MISEITAMAQAFDLHPELLDWEDDEYERAEIEQGINWRLHLQFDAIVLRRASDTTLPDAEVIRELQRRGKSRVDAVHQIAALVAGDVWGRLRAASDTKAARGKSPDVQDQAQARNQELNQKITALLDRK